MGRGYRGLTLLTTSAGLPGFTLLPVTLPAGRCQHLWVGTVLAYLLAIVLGLSANSSKVLAGFQTDPGWTWKQGWDLLPSPPLSPFLFSEWKRQVCLWGGP